MWCHLECAAQSLTQLGYSSFGCNAVAIYLNPSGVFNLFDSHVRGKSAVPDVNGTCVLLEINSSDYLVEYVRHTYVLDVCFELNGVKITSRRKWH